jgi:hypothetical protein
MLVFVAGAHVGLGLATVDGRVAQSAVVRLHVNLDSHATLLTDRGTVLHFRPQLQILLSTWNNVRG